MREIFHGELERLGAELAAMCGLVCSAMQHATRALLETDLFLAEQVITDDHEINQFGGRCEEHACALLALQAPVARDLRTVVTAIKAAEKLERMGDLARHVAEIARLRHPDPAVPAGLAAQFAEMGQLAVLTCQSVQQVIAAPSGTHSLIQERADDEIDRLHLEVLEAVREADPPYPVRVGVDVALLARYFERFADQGVSITRRLDWLVTGQLPDRPVP